MSARNIVTVVIAASITWAVPCEAQESRVATASVWTYQVKDGAPLVTGPGFSRYKPDTGEVVGAAPAVPVGALVTGFEVIGCDESAASELQFTFGYMSDGQLIPLASGTTGVSAQPVCGAFGVVLPTPHTADVRSYIVSLRGGGTAATRYSAVRLLYQLQVSAAPGIAAFADVPVGSPYHRFIEALAASGISGGCGGNMFCPDRPVTRGELAVFLATALGLHFPN